MSSRRMPKVFLISLYEDISSIGIRYLSSYLKSQGIMTSKVFMPLVPHAAPYNPYVKDSEKEISLLLKLIEELGPDFIGIGVMTNYFHRAARIASKIKERFKIPIIFGGIHATSCPEECLSVADIVCLGEAEETMLELCSSDGRGPFLQTIKGICYQDDGTIRHNGIRPLEQNLDKYPFPDYSLEDEFLILDNILKRTTKETLEEFLPTYPFGASAYRLMTTRGCPFSCTYCCNSMLRTLYKDKGEYLRSRSVANVIEEMRRIKDRFHICGFRIMDDSFLAHSREWFIDFARSYKKDIDLPFSCLANPNNVSYEIMQLLVENGLQHIQVGLESGSDKTNFDVYGRKITRSKMLEKLKIIDSLNPKPNIALDVIFDNPFENDEDRIETIHFLSLLNKMKIDYEMDRFALTFYPQTQLYDRAKTENLIDYDKEIVTRTKNFKDIENTFLNGLSLSTYVFKFSPRTVRLFLQYRIFYFPFSVFQRFYNWRRSSNSLFIRKIEGGLKSIYLGLLKRRRKKSSLPSSPTRHL
jgi:anaerobic magnesium-protoporphyrin IX monomethyl ester cyclase